MRGTPPQVNATAVYLLDADSRQALVNVDSQQRLPMASTTKIMTALVALQSGNLNKVVTIQQDAPGEVKNNNGSTANLVVGDQLSLKDLLYALLLPSGDDAAISVADAVSGSPKAFVRAMNAEAQKLHLKNTHYTDVDGLTVIAADGKVSPTNADHYTSAADLAELTRVASQNPLFAQISQLQEFDITATAVHHAYTWSTTNDLLKEYPGVTGVKTGYTAEAGPCLVFSAIDNGHHLIGVILQEKNLDQEQGKLDRFRDARTLLNWGFALPLLPPPTVNTPVS